MKCNKKSSYGCSSIGFRLLNWYQEQGLNSGMDNMRISTSSI